MNLRRLRAQSRAAGFGVLSARLILRRVPGAPRNEEVAELRLACPCGRAKTLFVGRDSAADYPAVLADHLERDGITIAPEGIPA